MSRILFENASVVTPQGVFVGYVATDGERITDVSHGSPTQNVRSLADEVIDLTGKYLMAGAIDDQVHFRDPGLTHKADIQTESLAAVAGGVTSFMDMPNTKPQMVTAEALDAKMKRASEVSAANYAFFIGATNDNIDTLRSLDYTHVPGVKLFLGASTGNMLVDDEQTLEQIFSLPVIVAIHSEDEQTIRQNMERYAAMHPDGIPIECHPLIRSREACVTSTRRAVERARRLGTRLHILHISTADELQFLTDEPLDKKRITAEVCGHHLWFTDADYPALGTRIKWNPAVKTESDRTALRNALNKGIVDIVATDHAPHLPEEKQGDCRTAASGGPLVQHSLLMMLEMAEQGVFSLEKVTEVMSARPAKLFGIKDRGLLKPGYYADLVIIDPEKPYTVTKENILTKCGWSPLEGHTFPCTVESTYVNGKLAWHGGRPVNLHASMPLEFIHPNSQG